MSDLTSRRLPHEAMQAQFEALFERAVNQHAPAFKALAERDAGGAADVVEAQMEAEEAEIAESLAQLQATGVHVPPMEEEGRSDPMGDPAKQAVVFMLRSWILGHRAERLVNEEGHCIVITAPEAWVETVTHAVKLGGIIPGEPAFISTGELVSFDDMRRFNSRPVFLRQSSQADRKLPRSASYDSGAAMALCYGVTAIGITDNIDYLPDDLRQASDLTIPLSGPWLSAVRHVAEGFGGRIRVPESLTDTACRALAPADLRSCRRPAEAGQGFLDRLGRLARSRQGTGFKATIKRAHGPLVTHKSNAGPGPCLDDLAGMDDAVAWGRDLATDLDAWRSGELPWRDVDPGCLLAGEPGTGKTTYAAALARSAGAHLVSTSYAQWQSAGDGHLGDTLKAMRGAFAEAATRVPCILFIDEVDSIPSRTETGADAKNSAYMRAVTNGLLECLQGTGGREGVVVLAATNHPGLLDKALVRAGRLDTTLTIPLPSPAALAAIIRHHLGDLLEGADLLPLARRAVGWTGADVERACRLARRRARHAGRPMLVDDLEAVLPGSRASGQRVFEAGEIPEVLMPRPGDTAH